MRLSSLPPFAALARLALARFALAVFALAPFALGQPAAAVPLTPEEIVQARILPGWRLTDGNQMAALELTLADHWKTYWRAPGDAGIPPSFDWAGSENLARVRFHWPRPELFRLNGETSVGYLNRLVLPIEFVPQQSGAPVAVKAKVRIGVCNDICVPVELNLAADLTGPGATDPAIEAALAAAPEPAAAAGVTGFRCALRPISDGLHLVARIAMPALGSGETALFETGDPAIWVGATKTLRQGGDLVAEADLVPDGAAPFVLDRSRIRITVLASGRAVELDGCPAQDG